MTKERDTDSPVAGEIEGVPLLDLTALSTQEEVDAIIRISDVALVLVPRSLAGALTRIPMRNVAAIVPISDDVDDIRVHTGITVMAGDGLAPDDGAGATLVVTGGLILTSPVEQVTYRQVIVTGMVVAPHGSETALGHGLSRVTGAVHYVDHVEDRDFKTISGESRIDAETLANEGGSPDDILILAGRIAVIGQVRSIGFRRILAAGQLLLPRDSERILAPALRCEGQIIWYAGEPRFFHGAQRFGRAFLEMFDEPTPLVLVGMFTFDDDVDPALLREKVPAITLVGRIEAPPGLVPALQFLTVENYGQISASQGTGEDR